MFHHGFSFGSHAAMPAWGGASPFCGNDFSGWGTYGALSHSAGAVAATPYVPAGAPSGHHSAVMPQTFAAHPTTFVGAQASYMPFHAAPYAHTGMPMAYAATGHMNAGYMGHMSMGMNMGMGGASRLNPNAPPFWPALNVSPTTRAPGGLTDAEYNFMEDAAADDDLARMEALSDAKDAQKVSGMGAAEAVKTAELD